MTTTTKILVVAGAVAGGYLLYRRFASSPPRNQSTAPPQQSPTSGYGQGSGTPSGLFDQVQGGVDRLRELAETGKGIYNHLFG